MSKVGGRASRQKGIRNERAVVAHIRAAGFECNRVPLSGAAEGFKGDVIVKTPLGDVPVEVKSRKDAFQFVYDLFYQEEEDDEARLAIHVGPSENDLILVKITTSFAKAMERGVLPYYRIEKVEKEHNRLIRLRQMLQRSAMLAIKNDYREILYLTFRDDMHRR